MKNGLCIKHFPLTEKKNDPLPHAINAMSSDNCRLADK